MPLTVFRSYNGKCPSFGWSGVTKGAHALACPKCKHNLQLRLRSPEL